MFKNSFYNEVAIAVFGIMTVILACRFTLGGMAVFLALSGLVAALMRRPSIVSFCFLMFPLMVIFNQAIIGMNGITLLVSRFAFCAMTLASLLSGSRGGMRYERLPLEWMAAYVAVACLSSIDGWMPLISYLKIMNFVIMIIGISLLAKQVQSDISCLRIIRVIFMAMAIIMILGSLVTYFIPSIGYSMMVLRAERYGINLEANELVQSGAHLLFNGLTCHSQMLSPVTGCLATWVLCDMILIERRINLLHCAILGCAPVLLYMSRSRGGLLMLVCVVIITLFVTVPRARLPVRVKRHLGMGLAGLAIMLVSAGLYFQIKNDAISRWIRKTDHVASDTRSLREAFTGSRELLVEMNLRDFKLNPLLGKGFQVVDGLKQAYAAGQVTWFSASVEKGVTPYVILGETGVLGAIAFLIFLCSFYYQCVKRGYMSLMTNFTCFLVANLADSTLFSPSGLGGFMWVVSCIGAFSTDCLAKRLFLMRQEEGWRMAVGGR